MQVSKSVLGSFIVSVRRKKDYISVGHCDLFKSQYTPASVCSVSRQLTAVDLPPTGMRPNRINLGDDLSAPGVVSDDDVEPIYGTVNIVTCGSILRTCCRGDND